MLVQGVPAALRCGAPARRRRGGGGGATPCCAASPGAPQQNDPESDLRKLWFLRRPNTQADKRTRLLGELAIVNERLRGTPPHVARQRVDFIRRRRRNWELIYQYVTSSDAAVTLSLIEAANSKAAELLSEEAREAVSVSDLVAQLQALQAQVAEANERAADTEARVAANLAAVRALEAEARRLDGGGAAAAAPLSNGADECVASFGGGTCMEPIALQPAPATSAPARSRARKGLDGRFADATSLALPHAQSRLAHYWFPIHFLSKARDGDTLWAFGQHCTLRAAPGTPSGWTVLASPAPGVGPSRELPTAVWDGMLAIWPGASPPQAPPAAGPLLPPSSYVLHAEIVVEDVPVEHGLLVENLLDLAHAPFTHTGTFAKGWTVPSMVRFAAAAARAPGDGWADMGNWLAGGTRGNWEPYPIDMAFEAPCCVLSHVGLAQAGAAGGGAQFVPGTRAADCEKHLHQLHVCLPSQPGRTRLLYRMALDFAPWAAMVPGMHLVWTEMAAQVLGEDQRLVEGQQDRMARGERVWGHPVAYDKCALAYRRFRNYASQCYDEADADVAEQQQQAQDAQLAALR